MNDDEIFTTIKKGIHAYLPEVTVEFRETPPSDAPLETSFNIKYGDDLYCRVAAAARRNLRPSIIPLVESYFAAFDSQFKMLVTDYITSSIADELRTKKIWFIDLAGNIYIEIPGKVFIFNSGNKRKDVGTRFPLVSQANCRLFFYLLKKGPQLTAGYREIALKSAVSLGKVSQTVAELKKNGLIKTNKKGTFIVEPSRLLELWVQSYLEKLKPQLYRGTFKWPHGTDFSYMDSVLNQVKVDIGIGGERAGELYTRYLKPAFMDLWVPEEHIPELKKQAKLMESQKGTVRIYSLFSGDILFDEEIQRGTKFRLLHPLLVYGDLLETSDQRCIETAGLVKEKFLAWIQ